MKTLPAPAFALILASLASIALVGIPTVASAGGGVFNGGNKYTCKSGKKVKDMKGCKENGGKN